MDIMLNTNINVIPIQSTMNRKYMLDTLVWELTMGCNLRCRHCGSSCKERLENEITDDEAMAIAEQIVELKPKWVAFSGGEPLLRHNWGELAQFLTQNGVEVRLISNGTLITADIARKMEKVGISIVSISVDGTEEIHDTVRGKGVHRKVIEAFGYLKDAGVNIGVNTTLMKDNVNILDEMYELLRENGVCIWQLQPGIPEGRMSEHSKYVLDVSDIMKVIDFSFEKNLVDGPKIFLAETIGYYTTREVQSRMLAFNSAKPVVFKGCNAGICSLGILQNGDVVGCTSIRKPGFVEGNLLQRTLKDIWNDPNAFSWRRNMKVSDLGPKCQKCRYAETCLGGCTNIRLAMEGSLNADNPMCVYAACALQ